MLHCSGDNMGWPNAPLALELDADEDDEVAYYAGKSFGQLHASLQRRFNAYNLNIVTIKLDTDARAVFPIYEDINSGGVDCSAQQIRR